jgi:hypothetical protein
MKKILLLLLTLVITKSNIYASDSQKIVINVTGIGLTQEDAKRNSYVKSLEYCYEGLLPKNERINYSKITRDSLSILMTNLFENPRLIDEYKNNSGKWSSTYQLTLDVNKLIYLSNDNNISKDTSSNNFVMKIKIEQLLEKFEIDLIRNLIFNLDEILNRSFEYNLKIDEPTATDSRNINWNIPLKADINCNQNITFANSYLNNVLKEISLSEEKKIEYKNKYKKEFTLVINDNNYFLRSQLSYDIFKLLYINWENYLNRYQLFLGDSIIDIKPTSFFKNEIGKFNGIGRSDGMGYESTMIGVSFNLPNPSELVANITFNDIKTLSELGKSYNYTIKKKPENIKYEIGKFSIIQGGIIVYLSVDSTKGLVIPSTGESKKNSTAKYFYDKSWNDINNELTKLDLDNGLILNGYLDWKLPTSYQMNLILQNIISDNSNSLKFQTRYACDCPVGDENPSDYYQNTFYISHGELKKERKDSRSYIIPIRIFDLDSSITYNNIIFKDDLDSTKISENEKIEKYQLVSIVAGRAIFEYDSISRLWCNRPDARTFMFNARENNIEKIEDVPDLSSCYNSQATNRLNSCQILLKPIGNSLFFILKYKNRIIYQNPIEFNETKYSSKEIYVNSLNNFDLSGQEEIAFEGEETGMFLSGGKNYKIKIGEVLSVTFLNEYDEECVYTFKKIK